MVIKNVNLSDDILIVKPKTGQHIGELISMVDSGKLELTVLNPKALSHTSIGVILYKNVFIEFEFDGETTYNLRTKKLTLKTTKVEFSINNKEGLLYKHFDYQARKSFSVTTVAELLECQVE